MLDADVFKNYIKSESQAGQMVENSILVEQCYIIEMPIRH